MVLNHSQEMSPELLSEKPSVFLSVSPAIADHPVVKLLLESEATPEPTIARPIPSRAIYHGTINPRAKYRHVLPCSAFVKQQPEDRLLVEYRPNITSLNWRVRYGIYDGRLLAVVFDHAYRVFVWRMQIELALTGEASPEPVVTPRRRKLKNEIVEGDIDEDDDWFIDLKALRKPLVRKQLYTKKKSKSKSKRRARDVGMLNTVLVVNLLDRQWTDLMYGSTSSPAILPERRSSLPSSLLSEHLVQQSAASMIAVKALCFTGLL